MHSSESLSQIRSLILGLLSSSPKGMTFDQLRFLYLNESSEELPAEYSSAQKIQQKLQGQVLIDRVYDQEILRVIVPTEKCQNMMSPLGLHSNVDRQNGSLKFMLGRSPQKTRQELSHDDSISHSPVSMNSSGYMSESLTESFEPPAATCSSPTPSEIKLFIDRLVQLVKSSCFGALDAKFVPVQFFKTYGTFVLSGWLDIVKEHPRVLQIERIESNSVLLKVIVSIPSPATLKRLEQEAKKPRLASISIVPPPLRLPSEKFWNVQLLSVTEENEILLRLVEPNQAYFDFLKKLASFFEKDSQHLVHEIVPWRIYVAHSSHATVRVRALVQKDGIVKCYYVDDGGYDDLPITMLRELPSEIAQIPLQIFKARLHNLGSYDQDARIKSILDSMIEKAKDGLAFVCEPISLKPLDVVLHDISKPKRQVLNALLYNSLKNRDQLGI